MTISKIKNNKIVKWIVIVLICYLLASVGANGVINPYYYVNAGEQKTVQVVDKEIYRIIDLSSVDVENGYLNIMVNDINTFQVSLNVMVNQESETPIEEQVSLCRGINTYKLSDFGEIKDLSISQKELTDTQINIDNVFWSSQKQVDTLNMLKIFISFLAIIMFYNFVTCLKNKYAK